MTVWSIMVTGYQSFVVVWNCSSKFVFIDSRSSNSECPDSHRAVTRINIWLARLFFGNFKEGLHFIAENQVFLRNQFSQTPRFLYWLIAWQSEICLTSLIALFWNFLLFWNFPLMICNFPLLFSHSKNIRMSTLITIIITY